MYLQLLIYQYIGLPYPSASKQIQVASQLTEIDHDYLYVLQRIQTVGHECVVKPVGTNSVHTKSEFKCKIMLCRRMVI